MSLASPQEEQVTPLGAQSGPVLVRSMDHLKSKQSENKLLSPLVIEEDEKGDVTNIQPNRVVVNKA